MDATGRNQTQGVVVLNPAMKPFVCHECGAGFHCTPFLENHQKFHTGEHQFICTTCHYTFDNPKTLKTHMVVHRNQSCPICYNNFKDIKDLEVHMLQAHQNVANIVITNNVESAPPLEVKQEVLDEGGCSLPDDESTGEIYQCSDCAVVTRHESVFYNHVKFHRGDFPFICNVCNNSFKHFMNFNEHKRSNPGEMAPESRRVFSGNNLKCEYCGIFFRCKPFIDNHLKFHLGIHPFMCNVCYYSFDELKTLIRHKQIHGFEMLYTCGFCPMVFVKESDYDKHQLMHYQGKGDSMKFSVLPDSHNDFVGDPSEKSNQTLTSQKESYYITNVDSNSAPEEQSSVVAEQQPQNSIFLSQPENCNGESFITPDGVNMVLIPVQAIVMDPEGASNAGGGIHADKNNASTNNAKPVTTTGTKKTATKKGAAAKAAKTPKKATNDINPNNEEFKCIDCKAEFRCQALLDNHMKYHTGEHPFMCPSCHYTFNNVGTLTKHKYIHQEIKPYECHSCHGTFRRQFELDRHMNKCHRAPRKLSPKATKKTYATAKNAASAQMPTEFFDALSKARKGPNQEGSTDSPEPQQQARNTENASTNSPKPTVEQPSFTQTFVSEADGRAGNKMQSIQNVVLISNLMGNDDNGTGANGVPAGVNYVVMPANAVEQGGWNYAASSQAIVEATQHNLVGQALPDTVATQQALFQNGNYSYVNLQPAIKNNACVECGLEFQNEFDLDNHLLSHTGFSYMCEICHYSFDSLANLNTHVKLHAEELSRNNCEQNFEQVTYDTRQVATAQVVNRQDVVHPNMASDQFKKMDILTASLLSSNIVGMVSGEETRIVINHEGSASIIPSQLQGESGGFRDKVQAAAAATVSANIPSTASSSYSNLTISNGLLTQTYGVISKGNNNETANTAQWQYNVNSQRANQQQAGFKRDMTETDVSKNRNNNVSAEKDGREMDKEGNETTTKNINLDNSNVEHLVLKQDSSSEQAYEQVGDKSYVALQPAAPLPVKGCKVELERITFENLENRVRWGDEEGEVETPIEDFKGPVTNTNEDAQAKRNFASTPRAADVNFTAKKGPAKKRTNTGKQKSPANKKKSKNSKINS